MSWMPAEWSLHTSKSKGMKYYFNGGTGERYWVDETLPQGWAFDKV
jgi:hypothetical protein